MTKYHVIGLSACCGPTRRNIVADGQADLARQINRAGIAEVLYIADCGPTVRLPVPQNKALRLHAPDGLPAERRTTGGGRHPPDGSPPGSE